MLLHKIKTALTAFVSRVFYASVDLKQEKKSSMDRTVVKDLVYGGLIEMMQNKDLYYYSSVGAKYSHWTDRGTLAVSDHIINITQQIHKAEDDMLDERAKQLVMKELKR